MRVITVLFALSLILGACHQNPHQAGAETFLAGKSISLANTAGWVKDDRYVISQPSNVISYNGYTYLFYVSEPVNAPLAGTGYSGKINYAFSRDQGNTWSDQGLVVGTGLPGAFDALGVCKPSVIKVSEDNFFYLYYVGVAEGYNPADSSSQNKTSIGLAKIIFSDNGIIRVAIKLNSGKPILEASAPGSRKFDSFRIDDPNPINLNGQVWLYYSGIDKLGGDPRTGLAVSSDINASHIRQNNDRALLDGSPSLIQKQDVGVIAIFSNTQNTWYASDGIHFNKLKKSFPSAIHFARSNADQNQLSWGMAERSTGIGFDRWSIH